MTQYVSSKKKIRIEIHIPSDRKYNRIKRKFVFDVDDVTINYDVPKFCFSKPVVVEPISGTIIAKFKDHCKI